MNKPSSLKELPSHANEALSPYWDAITQNGVNFAREAWQTTTGADNGIGELLCRFPNDMKIEELNTLLDSAGADVKCTFSARIVQCAVRQAFLNNEFPVSVNISACMATDGAALLAMHTSLQEEFNDRYSPGQIIFEFLEDDAADNPCVEILQALRDLGYKLALDDVSDNSVDTPQGLLDARRLINLGAHVDFIKIDGKTLHKFRDAALHQNAFTAFAEFSEFFDRIKTQAPQAQIVVEWVDSPEEAAQLKKIFPSIAFVQGRNLAGQSRALFDERFANETKSPLSRFLNSGAPDITLP